MNDVLRSPWLSVSLAIFGLVVGYSLFVGMHGDIAHASYFCPAKQICNEGACAKNDACTKEDCQRCPQCQNEARS